MNYYGEYIKDLNRYAEFEKRRKVRIQFIGLSLGLLLVLLLMVL